VNMMPAILEATASLPAMVQRAAAQLATATNHAEILEAKEVAGAGFDDAKRAARLAKAKGAHDEIIANIHRRQADFLEIEAMAKRRLADEYDAAQERGEIAKGSVRTDIVTEQNDVRPVTAAELGISRKDIHEARIIRDAEVAEPGIARRALDARLAQGQEPTKAALREAVTEAAMRGIRGNGGQSPSNKNPLYRAPTKAGEAWSHLYGTCRALSEWATDENQLLALHGKAERSDDQTANIRAIRRAASFLNDFLEQVDA
jgi:hypothetical protein